MGRFSSPRCTIGRLLSVLRLQPAVSPSRLATSSGITTPPEVFKERRCFRVGWRAEFILQQFD